MTDRTTRIAELLLLENEVSKLNFETNFRFCKNIPDFYEKMTPIEKVMYAILERIGIELKAEYDQVLDYGLCFQREIEKYRVDFFFIIPHEQGIIIECDGHDFHEKTKEQAKYDKQRDRFLMSKGYKVLHFTGSEIYNDFDKIRSEIYDFLKNEWGLND
ncbi:MAG: DUF559 domain-containing protein [Clostridium sp.]|nr:DUF559 domain-containing protein [Clostridium sp.]